jgi:hypothetical protein
MFVQHEIGRRWFVGVDEKLSLTEKSGHVTKDARHIVLSHRDQQMSEIGICAAVHNNSDVKRKSPCKFFKVITVRD